MDAQQRARYGSATGRSTGAGFSTWGSMDPTDQALVVLIEAKEWEQAEAYCEAAWPGEYLGGLRDCYIEEVEEGVLYQIREHDGAESLVIFNPDNWRVA